MSDKEGWGCRAITFRGPTQQAAMRQAADWLDGCRTLFGVLDGYGVIDTTMGYSSLRPEGERFWVQLYVHPWVIAYRHLDQEDKP